MKSEWQTYLGTRYLYCDYRDFGMDLEMLKEEVEYAVGCMCSEPRDSVYVLTDVRGTIGTKEITDYFKEIALKTKPHVQKVAVVGLEGIRKLLAQSISRFSGQNFKAFDTIEQAKEWLVKS